MPKSPEEKSDFKSKIDEESDKIYNLTSERKTLIQELKEERSKGGTGSTEIIWQLQYRLKKIDTELKELGIDPGGY